MRSRAWIGALGLVVAALLVAGPACGRRAYHPASGPRVDESRDDRARLRPAGQSGWAAVAPPNTGFACEMPFAPRVNGEAGIDDDGARYQSVTARLDAPHGTFGVFIVQWEGGVVGDPLERAQRLADTIVERAEATDRRSARVAMPGFYAREDTGRVANGGFFALRQFIGRERLYVAAVAVDSTPAALRSAEYFMQSIALDREDAMLPLGDSTEPVATYLPDVDFAAVIPPIGARRSARVELDDETVDAVAFESPHPGGLYRVMVFGFAGAAPERALERVATHLSLGAPGAYLHASGFPGRGYAPPRDEEARAFLTGRRVYVLQVVGAASLDAARTAAFFDSFRIL